MCSNGDQMMKRCRSGKPPSRRPSSSLPVRQIGPTHGLPAWCVLPAAAGWCSSGAPIDTRGRRRFLHYTTVTVRIPIEWGYHRTLRRSVTPSRCATKSSAGVLIDPFAFSIAYRTARPAATDDFISQGNKACQSAYPRATRGWCITVILSGPREDDVVQPVQLNLRIAAPWRHADANGPMNAACDFVTVISIPFSMRSDASGQKLPNP